MIVARHAMILRAQLSRAVPFVSEKRGHIGLSPLISTEVPRRVVRPVYCRWVRCPCEYLAIGFYDSSVAALQERQGSVHHEKLQCCRTRSER